MPVADEKALRDLEYGRLKELVKEHVSSSIGEEMIDSLSPLAERESVEQAIAEVVEAMNLLQAEGRFGLGALHDLAPLLAQAREHTHLDAQDFVLILQTIESTRVIQRRLIAEGDLPLLRRLAERLTDTKQLGNRINRAIGENGELREDASPLLKKLARKRHELEAHIDKRLRSLIDRNPELVSEPVVTRRAGRLVIPIKSGATGAMDFVVHDRSTTGQTLYAEPTSLVGQNNAVAEMDSQIRDERLRILRDLTEGFEEAHPALLRNRMILGHIDSLFARAAYAGAHRCSFPHLSGSIALNDARHPLLTEDVVVPITLKLGKKSRMTVITGPNTGGKTVTLKTIGLLTLMTQSAIPIPASPDSQMAIVASVRSDIGDEQSIEQNLSTFSSHMENIVSILTEADSDSLILLDELGAGTDPQEGAALGLAILERLLESDALVAASTHLTPLKYFAVRHPAVKASSMEFDAQTLAPTFRVIEGVPGRSNAFVIASGLGLSNEIVDRARSFLSEGEISAEDIIEELQRERQTMTRLKEDAEKRLHRAEALEAQYKNKLSSFETSKEEELSQELRKLQVSLRRGQESVERTLAQVNASTGPEVAKAAYRKLTNLRGEIDRLDQETKRRESVDRLQSKDLKVGKAVHVRSLDSDGRIVHLPGGDKVTVDMEGIRVVTDRFDLAHSKGKKRRKEQHASPPPPAVERVSLQLNVRGMTVMEALRKVETYVDRLLLADVRTASILHGKGTGTLRDAIRSYLASCSFVRACGPAPPREGGDGVTVFELKGRED